MKLPRRQFLHFAMGAVAFSAKSSIAVAQAYPSRPVRIVVGYAAGGTADTLARLIGQWLSERMGQPFVIENRAGAGGNIATDLVLRAPADGYTLLVNAMPNIINAPLPDNFDFARDMTPIGGISRGYLVLLVHPSVPATTLSEFMAFAKANPGKLTMASAGNGTPPHMAGELFKIMTGVDIVHVPYRGGGPALADLLAGQVQIMFSNLPAVEHIKAGKLRALAITTAVRSKTLPELPRIDEVVAGYEASVAFGLCGPKGMPSDIVEKLNISLNVALADPTIESRLSELGASALILSPASFSKFLSDESAKWAKVAQTANIKLN